MVKKFYLLIFILFLFISINNVNAVTSYINYAELDIEMSRFVQMYDIYSSGAVAINTYYNEEQMDIINNSFTASCASGPNGLGCGVAFYFNNPVVKGNLFGLTVYIGTGMNNYVQSPSDKFVDLALGNGLDDAKNAHNNRTPRAYVIRNEREGTTWCMVDNKTPVENHCTYTTGIITFLFVPDDNFSSVFIPFTTPVSEPSDIAKNFYGYTLHDYGKYNNLTQSDLNSINENIDNMEQSITQSQNTTNEKLTDIDDTLNNSDITDPDFEEFEDYIAENGVITQLITLPVRLYTQILNSINSSCTPFLLGELFGHNLVMNCINPSNFFGSALWNTVDILSTGLFVYAISKKMIAVFHKFTNLEEGDILD